MVNWTIAGAGICILIQIFMGATIEVVVLTTISVIFSVYGFLASGVYCIGAWALYLYVFGNIIVALFGKTLLGQPLDSNLAAPTDSFLMVTLSSFAFVLAFNVIRNIRFREILNDVRPSSEKLFFLSTTSFLLGVGFWLLNRILLDDTDGDFGGLSIFFGLFLMAVIARTGALITKTNGIKTFDFFLCLIIVVAVVFGGIDNKKTNVALPVISYFVTILFYRGYLSLRSIIIAGLGFALFLTVLAPSIHTLRVLGQSQQTIDDRVELIIKFSSDIFSSKQTLDQIQKTASSRFADGYYGYFGDSGFGQMLLGRYASIQQIDPIVGEVNRNGSMGGEAIWPAFTRLVPRFINSDKPLYIESFNILYHYALIGPLDGRFPTLPLAGQAYAAYGIAGVLIISFLIFLVFLGALKKIGYRLHYNPYTIFFFCQFLVVYVSQGDFSQYVGFILRNAPLFIMVFLIVSLFWRLRIRVRQFAREG